MDLKAAGLIVGLLITIAGVFTISMAQEAGETGISTSSGIVETSNLYRPYFWQGVFIIVLGIVVTVVPYLKEET